MALAFLVAAPAFGEGTAAVGPAATTAPETEVKPQSADQKDVLTTVQGQSAATAGPPCLLRIAVLCHGTAPLSFTGNRIMLVAGGGEATVWEATTGRQLMHISRPHIGSSFMGSAVSRDGSRLVLAYEEEVCMLDMATGRVIFRKAPEASSQLWWGDPASGKIVGVQKRPPFGPELAGKLGSVTGVCFTPDGSKIVCADNIGLAVCSAATGAVLGRAKDVALDHNGLVAEFSRLETGGRWLLAHGSGNHVFDLVTGKRAYSFPQERPDRLVFLTLSPDGTRIAAPYIAKTDVTIFDTSTGASLKTFDSHVKQRKFPVFSPDGKRIAVFAESKELRIFDVQTGRECVRLPDAGESYLAAAFSPDGKRLAACGSDDTGVRNKVEYIAVWDLAPRPK